MFNARILTEVLFLPAAVALACAGILLFCKRRGAGPWHERAGFAPIALAYCTGHVLHASAPDWSNWSGVDAWQWLLPGVVVMAGIAAVTAIRPQPVLQWILRGLAFAGFATISLSTYLRFTWTTGEAWFWMAGLTLGGTGWWLLSSFAARHSPEHWFAANWLLICVASGMLFILAGSQRLLEMAMMLGAGLGVAVFVQCLGQARLAFGLFDIAPFILLGLWINAWFYGEMSWWHPVGPAIAPFAALVARVRPVRTMRPRMRGAVILALHFVILAIPVLLAIKLYESDLYGGGYSP